MFNQDLFTRVIKDCRRGKSLRVFSQECQISIATLSRIENGNAPDIHTFMQLCYMIGFDPCNFITHGVQSLKTVTDYSNIPFEDLKHEYDRRIQEMAERLAKYE